ncbi:hypothetical protein JG687_00000500 [Phytophthora cactorum]|uniref:B box-type domain-containing protein n=1 Tax=Phytophthora cactorum TaxID=29920 RepID=A0A329SQR9_9STRA|nr:hypothetical protein Pcac1_g20792 [Phytophthora cactorum]KAG2843547.1 hypothetical protein PC112_g2595 [Phytophthora cactorum]KAG2845003.1 hypothetical protein PC111_g1745 [Phytophthora cactorum]KAG2866776.1 hypothetical protein PC113_g2563 [Phytophthora cactorum]KAG2929533.1 hypothetical protein PC114_g2772 [Phytophthora cactorum]
MEDQAEDPSFASVLEPAQLQRPHCDQCRIAIADYECQRCVQRFCRQCELVIHHRLAELVIKYEESKSDGRPHQEFLKWISACQECGQNTQEFFCLHCSMYQCENCCATKHRQLEPHFFFCVEGSSPRMFPFASWNLMFVEMVKVSKGVLQDRAADAEAAMTLGSSTTNEEPEAKYSTTVAAHIKLEKTTAAAFTSATAAALGNLSINGPVESHAATQPPESQAKPSSRVNTTSIVDLTLDDESDASTSSSSSRPPPQPQIKEEFRVKTENTWLASATAAQQNPVLDVDELMEKAMGEDEDPVLRSMIGDYNALSAKIFEIDQEADRVKKKTKELSSVKPINMQEVQKARASTQKLRKDKAEAEKARDGVVADIVVYVKPDPEEMTAFLETCTADVPTAQTAIHRKCATLEASIRTKLEDLQRTQRHLEELIGLKKDALAEVTRLGAEVAQGEEDIRKLDKERREEFLTLCQYSKAIQTAVREVTGV